MLCRRIGKLTSPSSALTFKLTAQVTNSILLVTPTNFINRLRRQSGSCKPAWLAIAALFALFISAGINAELKCGSIHLTSGSDESTKLLSAIDELILETGFDCSIERAENDTEADIDITKPVLVSATAQSQFDKLIDNPAGIDSLMSININPITNAGHGWWITPEAVAKHPELKTVLDVLEHPELFSDSENSTHGLFFNCPKDQRCQHMNANLFRAFDMKDKGWVQKIPVSQTDLDRSINNAIEQGQNWFGYYRSPSVMTGRHKMVKLDFGIEFAGVKNWRGCMVKPVADCDDPKPSAWSPSHLQTVITDKLAATVPGEALAYLTAREFPGDLMSTLLATQYDKQLGTKETVRVFMLQHSLVWKPWVSADVASKIINALSTPH